MEIFKEKETESTYVEIMSKSGKNYIIGSLYRSPNTKEENLIHHLDDTLQKINKEKGKKETILGMDHNMDLLKSHHHHLMQNFLDMMLKNEMIPTITHSMRITHSSVTLIDNIFVSKILQ